MGSKHVANDMHFDVTPTFKYFLYLTDTTHENGAFTCVPKTHKITQEIREKEGSNITQKNMAITRQLPFKEAEAIPVEGEAGTLIIFTTETFHKAGIVSKGERFGDARATAVLPQYARKRGLLKRILGKR